MNKKFNKNVKVKIICLSIFFIIGNIFFINNVHAQTINLTGTGSIESNYVIPLNLHYGSKQGDDTTTDVYLNSQSRTDFSDVIFKDANGSIIPYYIESTGNYEVIPDDTRLGNMNVITPSGAIISSNIPGVTAGVAISNDNGNSWTVKTTGTSQLLLVSPLTGYYYVNSGNLVIRSEDQGATWSTIKDFTADGATVLPYGFTEDANGTLFMGQYQEAINKAILWRSTDHGDTWLAVYDATGDASRQHIHGVGVDPYTGYVYVGVDGSNVNHLLRSVDCSNPSVTTCTWTSLGIQDAVVQMIFGDGWRMFGNETPRYSTASSYSTIFRTTNDINFTPDLISEQSSRVLREVNGTVFATTIAQYSSRYPQVLMRSADGSVAGGTWKTVWAAPYDTTTGNAGPRYADYAGTPNGTSEPQLMVGATTGYKALRFFNGRNHYQALVYLKLSSLPANGEQITIEYGSSSPASATGIYNTDLVQSGLVSRWKLDEGTGTSAIDITSAKNAVITPGTGSWNGSSGRRAGSDIPNISLPGDSYHFNSDGYAEVTGSGADAAFQATKNFTVMAWVRSTNTDTNVKWLVGKGTGAADGWGLVLDSGILRFRAMGTSTNGVTSYNGAFIADGLWHLVGASVDNSNNVTLFTDGTSGDPVSLSPTISTNSDALRFGKDGAGLLPFTGDLDDVQYYNAVLTGAQMRQIYEARSFNATLEPGIVIPPKTYYVDSILGNDSYTLNQAQNSATPWKTLQHAEETADDGSTVHIAAGTYVENSSTNHSWYLTKGINYIADGAVTVKSNSAATRVIYLDNGTKTQTFTGITFDAEGKANVLSTGSNVSNKTFVNCTFTGQISVGLGIAAGAGTFNFTGCTFNYSAGSLLSYLLVGTPTLNFSKCNVVTTSTADVFSWNTASSLTISVDRSIIVANSLLTANGVFRVLVNPGTISLSNNVIIASGIFIYESSSTGSGTYTLKNNILYSTRAASGKIIHAQTTGGLTLVSDYNDIFSPTGQILTFRVAGNTYASYSAYQVAGYEAHGKNADPLFVNYAGGNYQLSATSTLIDAGTSLGFTSDYAGATVPQGLAPDIGAYEYDSTPPTAFSLSTPANNAWTPNQSPTLSWVSSSDAGSGLAKYQLYINNVLNQDNISTSATSITPSSPLADGTYTWHIKAIDNNSNSTNSTQTFTLNVGPSDPTLSNLTISSGTLSPAFSSGNTSYTVSVENSVTSVTVTPTINQANATITVNGSPVTSGTQSNPITLNVGSNTVLTVVIARDGVTTDTYTITVNRAGSNDATLSNLLVNGVAVNNFSAATTSYNVTLASGITSIPVVTATTNNTNATYNITQASSVTGTATVLVTAQDAITTDTYTINFSVVATAVKISNGGGNLLFFNIGKNQPTINSVNPTTSQTDTTTQPPAQDIFTQILRLGSHNNQVVLLQNVLKKLGFFPLTTVSNGNFGPATLRAVRAFQVKYKIAKPGDTGYGLVGPNTRRELNKLNY